MRKAVLYDSNTGNTKAMAEAIAEGARESGAEVIFGKVSDADIETVLECDILYLGCPAMGVEMVGDAQTDFCRAVNKRFKGRKVALFGSYGRGNGMWIRAWASWIEAYGGIVVNGPGTISLLYPDADKLRECRELGRNDFQ
jgi:flavodoxin short chain